FCFFFQAEDGIRDRNVTGVQTCALPILQSRLVDADGHVVGEAVSEAQLMPVAPAEMEQEIELKNPNLWSIDAPYMYKVESILKRSEERRVGKERRAEMARVRCRGRSRSA